jgi:hypothetical protein
MLEDLLRLLVQQGTPSCQGAASIQRRSAAPYTDRRQSDIWLICCKGTHTMIGPGVPISCTPTLQRFVDSTSSM